MPVAANNLLCLLNFALTTYAVLHLAAAFQQDPADPSDENHVFAIVNMSVWDFIYYDTRDTQNKQ